MYMFVELMLLVLFVCGSYFSAITANGLALGDGGGLALNFIRRTELPPCTNVSAKHETPAVANPLLPACAAVRSRHNCLKFVPLIIRSELSCRATIVVLELTQFVAANIFYEVHQIANLKV